jgi:MFS family permease
MPEAPTLQNTGMFRSLRQFNYRVWAVGAFVSNIGTWVQRTAQDWLVLTELTDHDAQAVGLVMALQYGPQFLLLPWTGIAADRLNQRRLLMLTQGVMGLLALALGCLTLLGVARLWHVCVFAFLFGCAAAFDAPVRQTFVSELVGNDHLANAVALNSTSFNAARMIGPAAAGLAIAAIGTGWAFLFNGLSFFAVLASLFFLRRDELRPNPRALRGRGGFMEGLRYVGGRPDLKAILLILFLIGTFGLNFPIFISTMAVGAFHLDAKGYGFLSAAMAVGTISGALLNARRAWPKFTSLLTGTILFGVGCSLAAMAPSPLTFAAALVLTGVAALTVTNSSNSLIQISTDPVLRGRMMSLRVGVALGGTPIGAPIVGWIANHYGPRAALCIGVSAGFAAAVVAAIALYRRVHEPTIQGAGSADAGG